MDYLDFDYIFVGMISVLVVTLVVWIVVVIAIGDNNPTPPCVENRVIVSTPNGPISLWACVIVSE